MTSPLIVVATAAEAAHVPRGLTTVITGIGKTAAAVATTRALMTAGPVAALQVINIGSAGALRDGVAGLFEPGLVLNHDINAAAIRSLGYEPHDELHLGDDNTVLATGDVFVTDPSVRERLAVRAHLVDMEGYAVAFAAQQFGLPVRLVKHVSDNADQDSFDWPTLVDHSARVLGDWLNDHVS